MDVEVLRAQIPALQKATYLNTGTFGPPPRIVTDEVVKAYELVGEYGGFSPVVRQAVEQEGYERSRTRVASFLNVTPDEIALTRSTSDGVCIIAYGLNWESGDEVVITDQEHSSGQLPWFNLHKRFGVTVRVVRIAASPAETLQRFSDAINSRTRLVFASHVCCTTGERLPVREICDLAHEKGTLVAIDGAHAVGQFRVNLQEIDPDFYVGCGHKWLLGPQGTSMLFVSDRHLETLQPSWIGWGAQQEYSTDLETLSFELRDSARRFEFATRPWPLFMGLSRAIEFIDGVGLEAIEARVGQLAEYLKKEVAGIPRLTLLTPQHRVRSAGLVGVAVEGYEGPNLADVFWDRWQILTTSYAPGRRVRFSVAFFTTRDEIDSVLEALVTLVKEAR